jgi:hypothetical protein
MQPFLVVNAGDQRVELTDGENRWLVLAIERVVISAQPIEITKLFILTDVFSVRWESHYDLLSRSNSPGNVIVDALISSTSSSLLEG